MQFAVNIIACMLVSPPPGECESELRVTLPYSAVNLRPLLSTRGEGGTELVSALGFNTLDARDLMRFRSIAICSRIQESNRSRREGERERETVEAVWTLAREIQAQLTEQAEWHGDFVKCAPVVLGTVVEAFKNAP